MFKPLITSTLLLSILLSGCYQKPHKALPFSGRLICKGYMVSGSTQKYWTYDIKSAQKSPLVDKNLKEWLDAAHYLYKNNNIAYQKSYRLASIKEYGIPNILKHRLKGDSSYEDNATLLLELFNVSNPDTITTTDKHYKIITNRKASFIKIIDQSKNTSTLINTPFHLFGQTLNPDETYLLFLEKQSNLIEEGANYTINVINLKTGKVFPLPETEISLPQGCLWLDS